MNTKLILSLSLLLSAGFALGMDKEQARVEAKNLEQSQNDLLDLLEALQTKKGLENSFFALLSKDVLSNAIMPYMKKMYEQVCEDRTDISYFFNI
jgi:hypothetical protein